MFKKSLLISLSIFLILMIFTSSIKHRTRNLEKTINIINKEIFTLKQNLHDANTDFVYLSSPTQLKKYLIVLKKDNYSTYDSSRIFFYSDELFINDLQTINSNLNAF